MYIFDPIDFLNQVPPKAGSKQAKLPLYRIQISFCYRFGITGSNGQFLGIDEGKPLTDSFDLLFRKSTIFQYEVRVSTVNVATGGHPCFLSLSKLEHM